MVLTHKTTQKLILSLILLLAPLSSSAVSDTNLVSYWACEESSGVRYDETDTNNDLTDNNTVTSTSTGANSTACDFTYANSEYLSISDATQTGLDLQHASGDFSFSAWINFTSLPTTAGQDAGVLAKYSSASNNRSWEWIFKGEDNNEMQLVITDDGIGATNKINFETQAAMISSSELGQWIHYAVVYDMSAQSATFYKNGVSVAKTDNSIGNLTSIDDNTIDFRIGHANQAGSQYIDAAMDEIIVFDTTLSQSDIDDIYSSGSAPSFNDLFTSVSTSTPTSSTYTDGEMISSICVYNAPTTTCDYAYASSTDVDVTINFLFLLFILTLIVAFGSAYVTYKLL